MKGKEYWCDRVDLISYEGFREGCVGWKEKGLLGVLGYREEERERGERRILVYVRIWKKLGLG